MDVRRRICIACGAMAMFSFTSAADAQWGALQRTLFRDFNLAMSPGSLTQPQGGPLLNFNQFFQRVEFDRVGQGYAYEFYRFFGPDSFGESTLLNLGALSLDLSPDPSLGQGQLTGIHGRAGFNTRTIPEVYFLAETGQRVFNQFSGVSSFNKEPLRYTATVNTGVQDFVWSGNMLFDSSGKINALGFYDFDMRIVNVGNFTADGVLIEHEQVTDFDTGPINVSGHIGMDLFASLLQLNGNPATAAPPRIFSAAAQKERTADELMEAMKGGEILSEEEVEFMIEQMFVKAFLNDPIGFIMNGPSAAIMGFEGVDFELSPAGSSQPGALISTTEPVPEPGTLILFGLTIALFIYVRKRGGMAALAFPR